MRSQLTLVLCVACITLAPAPVLAADLSATNAKVMDDFATAVNRALDRVGTDSIPTHTVLQMHESVLRVKAAVGGQADLTTISRNRKVRLDDANFLNTDSPLEADTQFLKRFYATFLRKSIERYTDTEAQSIRDAVDAFLDAQLAVAQSEALRRLHGFEVKYGPGSATLNFAEVVENFYFQRLPTFRPGMNGPSPWEVVSAYSTTYITSAEGQAKGMSVIEVGLRHYNFGYDPDAKHGLTDYLVPRYWTAAFAIGDGEDGALRWPLSGKPRFGGALSWGDLKVAYLFDTGDRWRLLVSRQIQLIPHLF
jgi:hypothetical protein